MAEYTLGGMPVDFDFAFPPSGTLVLNSDKLYVRHRGNYYSLKDNEVEKALMNKNVAIKMLKQQESYHAVLRLLENKVENLVNGRHDYPMWPHHDYPLDAFEKEFHGPVRETYYGNTIFLIKLLKVLRNKD